MDRKKLTKGKSGIAGEGLFAKEAIVEDAAILVYEGKRLTERELENRNTDYIVKVGRDHYVDALSRKGEKSLGGYVNHSSHDPNCKLIICERNDRDLFALLVAIRDINEGEELTFDYGEEYWSSRPAPKLSNSDDSSKRAHSTNSKKETRPRRHLDSLKKTDASFKNRTFSHALVGINRI